MKKLYFKNLKRRALHQETGFSLIELMVVVSIITLVSALTIPKYYLFTAKAARVEAYQNLKFVHTLFENYREDVRPGAGGLNVEYGVRFDAYTPRTPNPISYNIFCATNPLGFSITNCQKLRYFTTSRG